jgi:hypothetical protein
VVNLLGILVIEAALAAFFDLSRIGELDVSG